MKKKMTYHLQRLTILSCLLFCGIKHAVAEEGVVLTLKNGQELIFAFSTKPSITFGNEFSITSTDSTVISYDYSEVQNFRYDTFTTNNIEDIKENLSSILKINIIEGILYVYGLSKDEVVSVYTVGGQRIATQHQSEVGRTMQIPLTSSGVLIVRTKSGICFKLVNP